MVLVALKLTGNGTIYIIIGYMNLCTRLLFKTITVHNIHGSIKTGINDIIVEVIIASSIVVSGDCDIKQTEVYTQA